MKKIFTLIIAMTATLGMNAQTESYKPIVVDGDNINLALRELEIKLEGVIAASPDVSPSNPFSGNTEKDF